MKIKYFPEAAYLELFDNIAGNQSNYASADNAWIAKIFNGKEFSKESRIDANLPELSIENDEYSNIILLYGELKDRLTPKQASNPYLWAHLAHCEYWDYTTKRWAKEGRSIETIKQRFFCNTKDGNRIGFLRNSISRLWWMGYLSYQEERPGNPWELTKLLMSHSDICQSIVERNFSMNRNITIGILEAILEINNSGKPKVVMAEWRELCKYINRYGAVTILDALTSDEVKQLSLEYILSHRK